MAVALLISIPASAWASGLDRPEAIARGDDAWSRRAEGHSGLQAAAEPVDEAIAAYREVFEAAPSDLEARWKLMRALYYRGEHVISDREGQLEIFALGRRLGEEGLDQLAARVGGRRALDELGPQEVGEQFSGDVDAAGVYFWACAHWGLWGRTRGKFAAAREGVATRVRDYAEIVIAIDETFEKAGGHRVLGRLHTEAPRIPFITGWVDHRRAIRELERSLEIVPTSILSELYLIEALHAFDRTRRSEALERLRKLVARPPHPDYLVEDLNALEDARLLLAEWTG